MSSVQVPFTFEHNQIILRPEIPGLGPVSMLLDTGTDPSVIDLTYASESGLPLLSMSETGEGAGSQAVTVFSTSDLEIRLGDLVASGVTTLAVDLSRIAERLGQPLHGILGYSFLANRIVQIDYPGRMLRFFPDAAAFRALQTDRARHPALPMVLWDNFPLVEHVYVNRKAIRATLDTGSSATLTLFPQAIHYLGLTQEAQAGRAVDTTGYGGQENNRKAMVSSLSLAGLDFGPTEVTLVLSGNRAETPLTARGGNIGNGLLKSCLLTLDYQNQLVYLGAPD